MVEVNSKENGLSNEGAQQVSGEWKANEDIVTDKEGWRSHSRWGKRKNRWSNSQRGNKDALRKFYIQMSTGEKHRPEHWD